MKKQTYKEWEHDAKLRLHYKFGGEILDISKKVGTRIFKGIRRALKATIPGYQSNANTWELQRKAVDAFLKAAK